MAQEEKEKTVCAGLCRVYLSKQMAAGNKDWSSIHAGYQSLPESEKQELFDEPNEVQRKRRQGMKVPFHSRKVAQKQIKRDMFHNRKFKAGELAMKALKARS